MMKRLISYLYKRYGEPDLLDISRFKHNISKSLPITQQGDIDVFEIDEKQRKDFLQWAYTIKNDKYFDYLINALLKAQEQEIISKVVTEKQLLCARAARHGVEMVREQFDYLAEKYIALTTMQEKHNDRFEIFDNSQ